MTNTAFIKDFDDWAKQKKNLEISSKQPTIREGEVWWAAVGINLGVEISGKGSGFSRPVLILKKLSKYGFMGIPLTTQLKTGSWYVPFEFLNTQEIAVVGQAKVMSVSRLYEKIGQLPKSDLDKVKRGFLNLYK